MKKQLFQASKLFLHVLKLIELKRNAKTVSEKRRAIKRIRKFKLLMQYYYYKVGKVAETTIEIIKPN